MAKLQGKGTLLKVEISSVYTTIAQVTDLSGPQSEVGTFNGTSLDGAVGMEKYPTGFVDGGTLSGTMFLDPTNSTLQYLTDNITTPIRSSGADRDDAFKIIFPNSAATEWPFNGIIKTLGLTVALNDGIKSPFSIEVNGMVTYPT